MKIKSTIILLFIIIIQGCAVNKKNISSQNINKADTTAIIKSDSTSTTTQHKTTDCSEINSDVEIEEQITETIIDSTKQITTQRNINRTIKKTYNKKNDIVSIDTTSFNQYALQTTSKSSSEHQDNQTTEIQKGNQNLKWLFLIAFIALIAFLVKKFYRNLL